MKAKHAGSCHCKAVRFEVEVDATAGTQCNCTICRKLGTTHAIVKPAEFALIAGEPNLTMYEWGFKTGKRYFCASCGVDCFGRGHLEQVGGDYVSVSLNALDDIDLKDTKVGHFDGRHNNWQGGQRPAPWPLAAG
jgi:hypothetical protein